MNVNVYVIVAFISVWLLMEAIYYCLLAYLSARKLPMQHKVDYLPLYDDLSRQPYWQAVSLLLPITKTSDMLRVKIQHALSEINYPYKEIIVVLDGLTVQQVQLVTAFQLRPMKHKIHWKKGHIRSNDIISFYESSQYDNLIVIEKVAGGLADALNAGVNVAKHPYILAYEEHVQLDEQSLLKLMQPLIENTEDTPIVVTSAQVKSEWSGDNINRIWSTMAHISILRRTIHSGESNALAAICTDNIVQEGGYSPHVLNPQQDLIIRIKKRLAKYRLREQIIYRPVSVATVELPQHWQAIVDDTLHRCTLLFDLISHHFRQAISNRSHMLQLGATISPFVELAGYLLSLWFVVSGQMFTFSSFMLSFVLIIVGSILSVLTVTFEEWKMSFHRPHPHFMKLVLWATTFTFWYRPMFLFMTCLSLFHVIRMKWKGV